jgi:hypothetical protein
MSLGRLGVRKIGLRLARSLVGKIRKKRQTKNICPESETLARSGNRKAKSRKRKPKRHRIQIKE